MERGYWQVVAEEEARERLALFTPNGKCWRKVMPMGPLNVAPKVVAMTVKLKIEWDTIAKELGLIFLHQKLFWMNCYCMEAQPSRS